MNDFSWSSPASLPDNCARTPFHVSGRIKRATALFDRAAVDLALTSCASAVQIDASLFSTRFIKVGIGECAPVHYDWNPLAYGVVIDFLLISRSTLPIVAIDTAITSTLYLPMTSLFLSLYVIVMDDFDLLRSESTSFCPHYYALWLRQTFSLCGLEFISPPALRWLLSRRMDFSLLISMILTQEKMKHGHILVAVWMIKVACFIFHHVNLSGSKRSTRRELNHFYSEGGLCASH